MSALQNALRQALTPALGSARRGVSRYFTPQNAVAQSYIQPSSDLILNNDFSLSVDCVLPPSRGNLFGADTSDRFEVLINDAQNLIVFDDINKGFFNVNVSSLVDGRLHRIVCNYASGVFEVFTDGVSLGSVSVSIPTTRISYIGRSQSFQPYYQGIIANAVASVVGGGGFDYPIDRYYTPQNNTVLDESGSGNHGTFVNIAAGRSKYYQQRADGNFADLQGNVLEVAY